VQKGIKYEQFQYWKKRIKGLNAQIADQAKNPCRQGDAPGATWMEIPTTSPTTPVVQENNGFVATVSEASPESASSMEVQIGPFVLRLTSGFDRGIFRGVCEELRRLC
jgi:hypothetical protein